jgi:hypothetical protein
MAAFTTSDDVATRLARELTAAEDAQADLLIEQATALIADAAGKDDDWALALSPVPDALAALTIEVAARAMAAPIGVRSQQETIGSYNHSESYPDQLAQGLHLTAAEERRVRRIVFGTTTASTRPGSVLDDLYDLEGS